MTTIHSHSLKKCSDCGIPLIHEPMTRGVPGGDWFFACAVCEWHSEQEEPHTSIRKNLTPIEIVDIKLQINKIRDYVKDLIPQSEPLHIAFMMLSMSFLQEGDE